MTNVEFEDLMRADALGALLPRERERLDQLARSVDPADARRLAELDAVLAAFAAERELRSEVLAAGSPFEGEDPVAQRLTAAAAVAEGELRARLLHPVAPLADSLRPDSPRPDSLGMGGPRLGALRRFAGWSLLVAAAALVVWLGWFDGGAAGGGPRLDPSRPDDLRAGDPRGGVPLHLVLLQPTLTADARTISWAPVPGASGYDAAILDLAGAIVLERGRELQRSTSWELSPTDYEALRPQAPLRLRVTALDGVGLPIGSSGDVDITLR
ncbi:MAG: hypothetical protein KDE27_30850 [Planctomycetes bacterium]|nr:hypothetical protein [Planctomycetota bacterium]